MSTLVDINKKMGNLRIGSIFVVAFPHFVEGQYLVKRIEAVAAEEVLRAPVVVYVAVIPN